MMPVWARVAERFSGRTPIILGMTVCAFGCAAFEWAHALPFLCAARVLQGMGWSGVLVGSSFCATELAPAGRMGQALGAAGVLTLVAMALGPIGGELLAQHAGWPWLFRVAAITSLVGAGLALGLPRLRRRLTTLDEAGAPGVAVPVRRWPLPAWRPLTALLLVSTGFGAVVTFLADHTALLGGFSITPFFNAYVASAVLVRLFAGSLSDRVGRHPVILPSFFGQAAALAGLAALTASWQLWIFGAIFGVTHGLYYPAMQALIVERAPAARRARAVASGNFAFALGMMLAGVLGGALAERRGYPAVYACTAAASLGAMALTAWDRVKSRAP